MTTALTAIIGILLLSCAALLNLWQSAVVQRDEARKDAAGSRAHMRVEVAKARSDLAAEQQSHAATAETFRAHALEANKRIEELHRQLDIARGLTPEREKAAASELDEAFGRG